MDAREGGCPADKRRQRQASARNIEENQKIQRMIQLRLQHSTITRQLMKQTIGPWIPAAFCAIISFIALFASVGSDAAWWRPAFFAFLPMCFFFVGTGMSQMRREIRELRQRLGELEQKRV